MAHSVRRTSSTSGVSGLTTMRNLVPVSVWKQCRLKLSAYSTSMPVQPGAGDSCPAIACSECLRDGVQLICWHHIDGSAQHNHPILAPCTRHGKQACVEPHAAARTASTARRNESVPGVLRDVLACPADAHCSAETACCKVRVMSREPHSPDAREAQGVVQVQVVPAQEALQGSVRS